ncbi:MAG: hypothetical protein FD181_3491 [Prolixibacteraceae bacterium]|nr:MAG: hypothetical protein FD181_3491 [Prolixibacteraceae bacterium]
MLIHLKPRLFCYQVKSFINYFSDLKISHPQLFQHFFVLSFPGFPGSVPKETILTES